jgi:O-antigen/teichoic acid export membrane protein
MLINLPRLSRSPSFRHFSALLASNAIVAIISLASLPILTRIFSPADFGVFQLALVITAFFTIVSTLRLELAVVVEKTDHDNGETMSTGFIVVAACTLLFYFLQTFNGGAFYSFINAEGVGEYAEWICLAVLINGWLQLLRGGYQRNKNFAGLGKNRILEVATSQSAKLISGLISPAPLSLFLSQILGYLVAFIAALKANSFSFCASKRKISSSITRNSKFIKYNSPAAVVNAISLMLPAIFVGKYHGMEAVAFLALASRMLDMPFGIVSQAAGKVFYKSASDIATQEPARLLGAYLKTYFSILVVLAPAAILMVLFADWGFVFLFGDRWEPASSFLKIIAVWKVLEYSNAPVSFGLTVIGLQKIDLYLKLFFGTFLRAFCLYYFAANLGQQVIALAASSVLYYISFTSTTAFVIHRNLNTKCS